MLYLRVERLETTKVYHGEAKISDACKDKDYERKETTGQYYMDGIGIVAYVVGGGV